MSRTIDERTIAACQEAAASGKPWHLIYWTDFEDSIRAESFATQDEAELKENVGELLVFIDAAEVETLEEKASRQMTEAVESGLDPLDALRNLCGEESVSKMLDAGREWKRGSVVVDEVLGTYSIDDSDAPELDDDDLL